VAGNAKRLSKEEATKLRKEAGNYIRKLRTSRDMTQKDLAKQLELEYYTMISSVENGTNRVPHETQADWARALGVQPKEFTKVMLSYYDPATYKILFQD